MDNNFDNENFNNAPPQNGEQKPPFEQQYANGSSETAPPQNSAQNGYTAQGGYENFNNYGYNPPPFQNQGQNPYVNNNGNFYQQGQPVYAPPVYTQPFPQKVIILPPGFTPETYQEKKDIRRSTRIVSVAALIMLLISGLWATVMYFVAGMLGFSSQEVYEFISEPAILQYVSLLLSLIIFTFPFIIVAKISKYRISDLLVLKKSKKGKALPYFFFGMGFCAFANIASSYADSIFSSFGIEYSVDMGDPPAGIFGFLLSVIGTAVVPGLIEEFACRGIMFGILKKHGDAFAIITTAIIFGLMHGNFIQIPFATLVGLVLGLIRVKTGSMRVCFVVHAANNLVSVIFQYLETYVPVAVQNIIYTVYLVICMLMAIVALLMLNEREEFVFEKPDHVCTSAQKYKWFFSSPFVIIFAVLCLLESMMFFV